MYKYYVTFCLSVSNVSTLKGSSLRMRVNFFYDVFISFLLKVHAKLRVCSYTCLYCRYMQCYILFKSCFCLQQFLQMYCIGFVYLSTWFMYIYMYIYSYYVIPFPNKPWFLRVYTTSLLKTLWEKEKLLFTSLLKTILVFTCLHYKSFENTAGKGEIARNEKFRLFPLCFLPV